MNTQIVTSVIVSLLIKPVLLLLFVAVLWLLLRKLSASLQHFVLSVGVIGVFILTLLTIGFADVKIRMFPVLTQVMQIPVAWVDAINQWILVYASAKNLMVVAAIYLFPACFLIFYLLLGICGLWWQTRSATTVTSTELNTRLDVIRQLCDIQRPVRMVVSRDIESPQTWGCFRPVIMLPREAVLWDEDKQLSILIHELGHIARWDWLTTLLVKLVCAFFWFLLPVWWIAKQIYQQAEIACDDYIFKLRDKHLVYAKNLLAIASNENIVVTNESLYMRGHSPIYYRVVALLDKQRPHQPMAMEAAQYWVICSALLIILFASVQLIPLQEQLRKQASHFLVIDWSLIDKAVIDDQEVINDKKLNTAGDGSINVEDFNRELLQRLKPVSASHPEWFEPIEVTHVAVEKPDKQDLHSRVVLAAESAQIPIIQIEGFLPVDLVTPQYPSVALHKGVEGWVQVEFSIDRQGSIIEPRIIAHSPSSVFDRSVLTALKKSRYQPQLLDGQPVIVRGVTETFRFKLSTDSRESAQLRR